MHIEALKCNGCLKIFEIEDEIELMTEELIMEGWYVNFEENIHICPSCNGSESKE